MLPLLALLALVQAQDTTFTLSIPSIMRGPEIVGREPGGVRWTADGRWIYFRWLPPGSAWNAELKPYRVRAAAGAVPEVVSRADMDSVAPLIAEGDLSPDRTTRVVEANGDLYLVTLGRGTAQRLTRTMESERDPVFDRAGTGVFYREGSNLFFLRLSDGYVRQLSNIRSGPAPKEDSTAAGQRGFLERQQTELFDAVREWIREDSVRKADRKADDQRRWPAAVYLDKNESVSQFSVSPGGAAALVRTGISTDRDRNTKVPQYVSKSGYTEEIDSRTKVGDVQGRSRVGFLRLPEGEVSWLRLLPDTTVMPGYALFLGWNDAGTEALVLSTSEDYKHRYLYLVGADSGRARLVDALTDSAWVGGPCFSCGGWYDGGKRIWFVSEADGYAHLYTMAADGSDRRQLTRGKWEVLRAALADDKRSFLLHTSEPSPFERQVYRLPASGGPMERITTRAGGHEATASPDGQWLADVYSTANRPPELYLVRNRPGSEMAKLTTSPTAEWSSFPWIEPAIVWIPASDSVRVPARIYRPADLGAEPNGAAVIFVHGAGYLHNVHHWWSDYYREYMFHHFLARQGYVVLDIDYRGSAGYGRDWRTAIYRHMGGRDLQDQVDGARYLQREFGIGPDRIGIYGGSYGGFMTLMALFTEGKWFGAGAALRSVTDWAHYNNGYTGRILNLPQDDSVAYRRSSPIYFAEGLEDPLLIAHGMMDTNVHFQDVVRLTQRLIELHKTGWELAVYPVENHGFERPDSWTDEYERIYGLFENQLR
ncbi:MAG: prolyl oligopeptidase family serine peptidase [Gemmatimonadales bacterium]